MENLKERQNELLESLLREETLRPHIKACLKARAKAAAMIATAAGDAVNKRQRKELEGGKK